ncbi:MAG: tRNA (adenosine(37)-N6)-threonylcarbamoyltransferase complex ATPase subunit type 1 TsaE [Candidatus Omnitrophota bacterium]
MNQTPAKSRTTTITNSSKETMVVAALFAKKLKGGEIIALTGPLGAGKTVFVKGLAQGLGIPEREVRSPSFVVLIEHRRGRLPLFHFDFYRFKRGAEIDTTPFEDCLKAKGVIVVEWPERIADYLPPEARKVSIEVLEKKQRRIRIT